MQNKLIIKNLSFSYTNKQVLFNCNAEFETGKIYVLLGNNGVGKTTLFKCLIKQFKIADGSIFLDGTDINKISFLDYAKQISYVSQLNSLENSDITVRDYLVQGRTPYLKAFGVPGKDEYLVMHDYAKQVGIEELLSRQLSELSGGELQMVNITRALIQETTVIILDEPLSALDIKNQIKVLSLLDQLSKKDKIIIFSSHNPNHAVLLKSNVLLMKDGNVLCSGNYKEIIKSDKLSLAYGCKVNVTEDGDVKLTI